MITSRRRIVPFACIALSVLAGILIYTNHSHAAGGVIDPTFNPGGVGASGGDPIVSSIAIQPDGKIIIAGGFTTYNGDATTPARVMRLNADGTRDLTFNPGGLGAGNTSGDIVNVVKLQPDGKILIGGNFTRYNGDTTVPARIMRLNADGTRDLTFNPGGAGADNTIRAIALQLDGKIVIGGYFTSYNTAGSTPDCLFRLKADGTPDTTFNAGGSGLSGAADFGDVPGALALALQPDGKIVVGGTFTSYNGEAATPDLIMRVNADGIRDTTFNPGGTGAVEGDPNIRGDGVYAIALLGSGKIVIGGVFRSYNGGPSGSGFMRLNADGTPDLTFNPGGTGICCPGPGLGASNSVAAIAPDADGRLLFAGEFTTYNGDTTVPDYLLRVNADGTRDLTFNPGGSGLPAAGIVAIVLQSDGKFLIGGFIGTYNGDSSVPHGVMRLLPGSPNAAPTITAAGPLTRQQGSPAINSQIATVDDPESGAGKVAVTVTSANPANGVSVSNLINNNGNVTADVVASCSATNASFTLTAMDGNGALASATLNVTVSANSAPTLSYSTPQSLGVFGSLNVTPTSASDNGAVTYVVQTVTPALTTVPTVSATGVVGISNAQPPGSHVIAVRATDNCGVTTDASFTLNVSQASTATALSSSANPSLLAQSVTFTATVTSASGTPAGAVQFKDNGSNLGSPVTLNAGGVAQFTTSTLTAGTHTITADYSGNANFVASSATLSGGQVVNNRALIKFSQSNYSVNESGKFVTITVNRSGDTGPAVNVDYATPDDSGATSVLPCSNANGIAAPRCDFTTGLGTLKFATGETSKTFTVLIQQDSFVEGNETLTLILANPTGGAGFAQASDASATLTIVDDDVSPSSSNPIDDPTTFVRQHYHDFLNREPDDSGLAFWTGQITSCGSDAQCTDVRRINVSAAFFLSTEFQQTGDLVERFYKVAYADAVGNSKFQAPHQVFVPVVRFSEFIRDTFRIGQGVVVLAPGWEQALENNKQAYALEFVQTPRFIAALPASLRPDQFVDRLNQNTGGVLSLSERTAVINLFGGASDTTNVNARAQAVRQVADDQDLFNNEFNRAFVLAEYFGYLRRNPDDAPETTLDYTGYDFWLTKLNQANGNYISSEMVKAFLTSSEYRQRFGSQ